ncbi:hypothetical protein HYC85_023925 [Camellia sinensis]|uniref:Vesicle-fusing ATPase n=1 Tax=Camellia sinensis TaxID=4442 RepID=A0A7J7GJR6_CAMSI|nr:hypothetical protein HYC85_023925 [Camellia sinensis]
MESLKEELISLGIRGMTSQFAQILQSAFGSRMVSPSQAKRPIKHISLKRVQQAHMRRPRSSRHPKRLTITFKRDETLGGDPVCEVRNHEPRDLFELGLERVRIREPRDLKHLASNEFRRDLEATPLMSPRTLAGSELSRIYAPELWAFNLKHVRGMLLYGPPGSGKTLIARNICKLLNAKEPLIIHGPDVLNAFQGVSERKIRSLFEAANEDENRYGAKSDLYIIIFDEIDSIAKAILENLHAFQIDGMKVLNNIFIIATTNRKELIDEALLREGRIELHVKLEYPDERGRLQILDINTRNMRQAFVLDEDVNLQEIACRMDGCSGFAIASLVTRAHSYVVVQAGERGLVKHVRKDAKVTMNHFLHAIEDINFRMEKEEMILQPFSSSNLTEVLHIQQDIARLKEDSAHFQATLASYKEDAVKLEKELETLRCALDPIMEEQFDGSKSSSKVLSQVMLKGVTHTLNSNLHRKDNQPQIYHLMDQEDHKHKFVH